MAWIKPITYPCYVIIDNRAELGWREQGYHFEVNCSGALVFMSADDTENLCEDGLFSD